jgi:hypothetical protein
MVENTEKFSEILSRSLFVQLVEGKFFIIKNRFGVLAQNGSCT